MDRAARRGTLLGDVDLRARRILAGQSSDEPALETGRYRLSQMEGEQAVAAARRRATVAETDAHYQRLAKSEDLLHRAAIEAPQLAARLEAETDPDAIESHAADFLSRYAQVAGTPEFGARFDRLAAPISHLIATKPAALRQRYTAAARGLWPHLDPQDVASLSRIEASPFFDLAQRDPEFARALGTVRRQLLNDLAKATIVGVGSVAATGLQPEAFLPAGSTVQADVQPRAARVEDAVTDAPDGDHFGADGYITKQGMDMLLAATAKNRLAWSTKDLTVGIKRFHPVHQIAVDRALAHLPESDRVILRQQQVVADREQSFEGQFRHAMRDGRLDAAGHPRQTVEQARVQADEFVRERILIAQNLEKRGRHRDAMEQLGLAIHTLQDATSPAHRGFQPWGGPEARSQWAHVSAENEYPGDDSDLFRVTQQAYRYFDGSLPMPKAFFP